MEFNAKLELYEIIFQALSKVINFFQLKLVKDSARELTTEDLDTMFDLSNTCFIVLENIKKIILSEGVSDRFGGHSHPSEIVKEKYEIHSSKEEPIQNVCLQYILKKYIPISFIYTFIESLIRLIFKGLDADDMDNVLSNRQCFKDNPVKKIRAKLKDLIAEYISIIPKVKFIVIKYFHDVEHRLGIRCSSSLVAEVITKSIIFGKFQRIEDYMSSKDVEKLDPDEKVLNGFQA